MNPDEILSEIDATLKGLIRNAKTLQGVDWEDLSQLELESFQKTQESLIQHLLHMDEHYKIKGRDLATDIQKKYEHFEALSQSVNQILQITKKKNHVITKRRKKRLILYRT